MSKKKIELVKCKTSYKGKEVEAVLFIIDGEPIDVNELDDLATVYDHRPPNPPGQ